MRWYRARRQLGRRLAARLEFVEWVRSLPDMPRLLELFQIVVPERLPGATELVEIRPVLETGLVSVVEDDLDRITPDRAEIPNVDLLLADLKFCRRR